MPAIVLRSARWLVAGAAVGALAYWLTPELEGYRALVVVALEGFVAGALIGSPAAVLLAPAAIFSGYEIWHAVSDHPGLRWSPDDTVATLALVQLIFASSAAVGATLGWLAASGRLGTRPRARS